MVLLGIDYGERRMGVAKSDSLGFLASGLTTIEWNHDTSIPVKTISELIRTYHVEKIVMGLPINMDDSEGEKALKVRGFAKVLETACSIPVDLYDERLSTAEAHEIMHMQGRKTGKDKKSIDMIAACVILQSYLDNVKK
ncbi:MAG: Holliday junction resolvase RuvX [Clostridia bacterium]|jgi:putative Holliday junction resolvase